MTAPYRVDRLWPDPTANLDLDEAFHDLALPPAPAGRAWLGVNMVTTIDGRATRAGTAEAMAGRADRRLMRLLRSGFDAVASGAGTLRRSDFFSWLPDDLARGRVDRGLAPQPIAVLIAGHGEVPLDRRFFAAEQPRIVATGTGHDPRLADDLAGRAELLIAPTPEPEPAWLLSVLRERGIRSVLLEGGPSTNARFLAADLIDELYWTVGARLLGNDGLPMMTPIAGGSPWEEHPRPGRLVSVHRAGDDLFLRYRFQGVTGEDPA